MSEAPERIWATRHPYGAIEAVDYWCSDMAEYIRADVHQARIAELEARLVKAEKAIGDVHAPASESTQ